MDDIMRVLEEMAEHLGNIRALIGDDSFPRAVTLFLAPSVGVEALFETVEVGADVDNVFRLLEDAAG